MRAERASVASLSSVMALLDEEQPKPLTAGSDCKAMPKGELRAVSLGFERQCIVGEQLL